MIVFDLDDTLFAEKDFVESGQKAVLKHLRTLFPDKSDDELLAMAWTPEIKDVYRYHKPKISLTDDARYVLEIYKNAGHRLAIITDGRSRTQRNKCKALGIYKYVPEDMVLVSEETGFDKTHAEPFKMLMERCPDEKEWVYIGDNPAKDFYWPKKLGWATVMLAKKPGENVHPQRLDDLDPAYHPQTIVYKLLAFAKHHLTLS